MKFEKGNLLEFLHHKKIDILVHGCNCFNTMGAGITKQIKEKYIEAYNVDLKTIKGDKNKLGTYTITNINENQYIINAYTQYRYSGKHPLNYDALRNVFRSINNNFSNMKIGIPKIGAGLAGGRLEYDSKYY